MLNRFNHLGVGQFNNRANFAVPNHLADLGGFRPITSRGNTFISDEVERKRRLDEELAHLEANICRQYDEQCARQAETDRETVRMIKELEKYDKARKMRRDISNEMEIQDCNNASYHPNEVADTYDSRTMVDDSGLYAANALPYSQGGVRLGTWSGGNPSQYVTFASDSLYRGDRQYSAGGIVAPGVGIDDSEGYGYYVWEELEKHRSDIERMVDEAERHAREIMGDFLFDLAINLLNIFIDKEVKKPINILILLYGIYQCVVEAYKEEIRLYMQEYNCSYDEAKEKVRPTARFIWNFWRMMMGDWLNEALDKLGIPMIYRKTIIHIVNELIQNKNK